MKYLFLLDVVDAGVSSSIDKKFLLVIAFTIVIEALLMLLLKFNHFSKSALDSSIVNISSLAIGFILIKYFPSLFGSYSFINILILLVITIAIETPVLYLFNKKKLFTRILIVSSVMNIVSYALFFLFLNSGLIK
jgi:hypothetical protein